MKQILLIGFGGFIGSVARYLVSKLNGSCHFLAIPIGTLTVNIVGSFVIGIIIGLVEKTDYISTDLRLFLVVGLCGGFTTFSSFTGESLVMMQQGQLLSVLIYTSISIILGFAAVYIGYLLT